jgi:hypothetical protein
MRIVQLESSNIKRLTAVSIRPDGSIVQITGPNAAGKSSVIDSIFYALAGAQALPSHPIRNGAAKAVIKLDLGELVVTRRFTGGNTYLEVASRDGATYKSPQRVLDGLLGALTFDPLAFAGEPPKAQLQRLRQIAGVDVDALDREAAAAFASRTETKKRLNMLSERAAVLATQLDPALDPTPIDITPLLDQITEANLKNEEIQRALAERRARAETAGSLQANAERWRDEARKLLDRADEADAEASTIVTWLNAQPALPYSVDVLELRAHIAEAQRHNQVADRERAARAQHEAVVADVKAIAAEVDNLTATIEACRTQRDTTIAAAKMPVDGLGFGEGEITYHGLPFAQASRAEQIRVATAIGMALNPKLRILCIRDGSLLDEQSLAALEQMAEQHDFQVWVERVDSSGRVGIAIEDGTVVAVNGEPVEQEAVEEAAVA